MMISGTLEFTWRDMALNHSEIERTYPERMLKQQDLSTVEHKIADSYRNAVLVGKILERRIHFADIWTIAGSLLLITTATLGLKAMRQSRSNDHEMNADKTKQQVR